MRSTKVPVNVHVIHVHGSIGSLRSLCRWVSFLESNKRLRSRVGVSRRRCSTRHLSLSGVGIGSHRHVGTSLHSLHRRRFRRAASDGRGRRFRGSRSAFSRALFALVLVPGASDPNWNVRFARQRVGGKPRMVGGFLRRQPAKWIRCQKFVDEVASELR